MRMMMYVVYTEDTVEPIAACSDRDVACQVCDEVEATLGYECWIQDTPVISCLGEFKNG